MTKIKHPYQIVIQPYIVKHRGTLVYEVADYNVPAKVTDGDETHPITLTLEDASERMHTWKELTEWLPTTIWPFSDDPKFYKSKQEVSELSPLVVFLPAKFVED